MAVLLLLAAASILHLAFGDYVVTTPQSWVPGHDAQICMATAGGLSQDDSVFLTVYTFDSEPPRSDYWTDFDKRFRKEIPTRTLFMSTQKLPFESGKSSSCTNVTVQSTILPYGEFHLNGTVQGVPINQTRYLTFSHNPDQTFVQTDKYLYDGGQHVRFRVLSLNGPYFQVSYDPYTEIYVETPSGNRIVQWLNVSNTDGLIEKEFQLIDEPQEGIYTILVRKNIGDSLVKKTFKVEEYVLPRFEVVVTPPNPFLATEEFAKIRVCADYTFGQPLKGILTGSVDNDGYGERKFIHEVNESIFGCKDLNVPMKPLEINAYYTITERLNVDLKVEEEGTGNSLSKTLTIPITRVGLKIESMELFKFRKPELPYANLFRVTHMNGSAAANEPIQVCADEDCQKISSDDRGFLEFSVPPHVQFSRLKLDAIRYPELLTDVINPDFPIQRKFLHSSTYVFDTWDFHSPSNSSLQLLVSSQDKIKCSADGAAALNLTLLYSAVNVSLTELNVQVISRGQIQFSEQIPLTFEDNGMPTDLKLLSPMQKSTTEGMVRGHTYVDLNIPFTMSPKVKVLVWYTRPEGEVVPDFKEFEMTKCMPHQVQMTWPKSKAEFGEALPLTLKAEPNSLCGYGVVDKSVDLLAGGRDDLSVDKIFSLLSKYEPNSVLADQVNDHRYCKNKTESENDGQPPTPPYPSEFPPGYVANEVDASKMFDDAGVFIVSDNRFETRTCVTYLGGFGPFSGGPRRKYSGLYRGADIVFHDRQIYYANSPGGGGPPYPVAQALPHFDQSSEPELDAPRVYFPETWLWELAVVNSQGSFSKEVSLPHTITEWVGKAICVHPGKGIGLSDKVSITSFTPFFIDVTMAPSLKRGEIMPVVISVFNYHNASLPVRVTMEQSLDYEVLSASTSAAEDDGGEDSLGTSLLCIPSGDKGTVSLNIRPLTVGDAYLRISASVDETISNCQHNGSLPATSDSISKLLSIDYEGFPEEKAWTKYVCDEDVEGNATAASWELAVPAKENVVPDSARRWVSVVGGLLGPSLENLEDLIRMPFGCGEQNMVRFAPNIFIHQYLDSSGLKGLEVTKQTLASHMRKGYQRELNYEHQDGSFSAFGEKDDSGSTWLTAFVVKCFAQSRPYIYIDENQLKKSTEWLKQRQAPDGCFSNVGKVLHKEMKGGVSDAKPKLLSAFVLISLLEAGEMETDQIVLDALKCLSGTDGSDDTSDPYQLSLVAYAHVLAKSPMADAKVEALLSASQSTSAGISWNILNSKGEIPSSPSPAAVETAGYAILAMLNLNPSKYLNTAVSTIKWMSEQRNSQGGFVSTQDTVVALQALSLFESYQSRDLQNLTLSLKFDNLPSVELSVNKENELLNQRQDMEEQSTNVSVSLSGNGCSLIQGVVRYNVKDPKSSDAFNVSVSTCSPRSTSNTPHKRQTIKACTSYLLPDGISNMAVMEVKMISGFIPEKADLKEVVGDGKGRIKRYEVDGPKVLFYFDDLVAQETCVEFSVVKEIEVLDPKPGTVIVYDYYEPEFVVTENFNASASSCSSPSEASAPQPPPPPPIPVPVPVRAGPI